jgi:tetratricopeptide (TPR) repeat protein
LWRDEPETYRLLAVVLSKKGDDRRAFVALREVLRLCPDDIPLRKHIAAHWEKMGEDEEAITEYGEVLARAPDDYETMRELGKLFFRTSKFDRVIPVLSDYLRLFPDDMECQFWMGAAWFGLGQPQNAVPFLRRVVGTSLERHESTHLLVLAYRDLGMLDEAIALHEEHLRKVPDCQRAHILQGTLYYTSGELQQTEREYRTAIDHHGTSCSLLLALARTQMEMGRFEEAVPILEQAAQGGDRRSEVFLELGKALRRRGEYERAEEALKRAIEIGGQDSSVDQELSMLYMETGRWELASHMLRAASS